MRKNACYVPQYADELIIDVSPLETQYANNAKRHKRRNILYNLISDRLELNENNNG